MTGLQPGTTYTFNVAAENQDGISPFSDTASLTLEEQQPGNLHLLAIYVTSLWFAVEIISASAENPLFFLKFRVSCKLFIFFQFLKTMCDIC